MKLEEIFEDIKLNIQEATGNIIGRLKFQWIKAGSINDKNHNNRYYDESLIKKIVKQFNSKNAHIAGQINHPLSGRTKLDKVSHVLTKLFYDEKTKVGHAEAAILNTNSGRDMKVVVQQNLKDLGTSLRGFGNIEKDGKIKEDDYQFETIDVILKPSFKNAVLGADNLFESGNKHFEEEKFNVSLEEFNNIVNKTIEHEFLISFPDANFLEINTKKAYEKYMDENWATYAEIIEKELEPFKVEKSSLEKETEKAKGKVEIYTSEEQAYDEALVAGYDKPFETFKKEILPALSEKEDNLRAEFDEYKRSGGLQDFKSFKKLKENK